MKDIPVTISVSLVRISPFVNGMLGMEASEALRAIGRMVGQRDASEKLLPGHDRNWLLRQVTRLCEEAKVPRVTSHGLRGTASSLAQAAGMIGEAVANNLGHRSYETTRAHYTDPSAPANAQTTRVVAALR